MTVETIKLLTRIVFFGLSGLTGLLILREANNDPEQPAYLAGIGGVMLVASVGGIGITVVELFGTL